MKHFITPGAAILCAISLAISGWALGARFHDTNARRKDQAAAWHIVICYLEGLTKANTQASPDERYRAIAAYDHILDLVQARRCV